MRVNLHFLSWKSGDEAMVGGGEELLLACGGRHSSDY